MAQIISIINSMCCLTQIEKHSEIGIHDIECMLWTVFNCWSKNVCVAMFLIFDVRFKIKADCMAPIPTEDIQTIGFYILCD